MNTILTKKATWEKVLNTKARIIHQQIASLQRWVEKADGGKKMLEELSAPYYELLHSIYKEDFIRVASSLTPEQWGLEESLHKAKVRVKRIQPRTQGRRIEAEYKARSINRKLKRKPKRKLLIERLSYREAEKIINKNLPFSGLH